MPLREQPDVRHDRDPDRREAAHDVHDLAAALEFDTLHAALLYEAHRVRHGGVRRRVVRAERHVRDEERVGRAPRDGLCVVDHLVEGELRRRGVPEAHLRERVADERDVGQQRGRARERRGVVVCRHHRNRCLSLPQGVQGLDRHFLARNGWCRIGGCWADAHPSAKLCSVSGWE